jgi:hypothetical protein
MLKKLKVKIILSQYVAVMDDLKTNEIELEVIRPPTVEELVQEQLTRRGITGSFKIEHTIPVDGAEPTSEEKADLDAVVGRRVSE